MKFENGEKTIFLQVTVRENSSLCVYDFANNIEKVRFVEAFLRSEQLSRKV